MRIASETGQYDPITQKFIDNLQAQDVKPIYKLSVPEARDVLEQVQSQPANLPPAQIEDRSIPVGPKGHISIRLVRPPSATGVLPAVVYFHGGGWILGSQNTHDRLIREIANQSQSAVVFVDYTPSPETKYPVPVEEAYAATKYVADHSNELNVSAERLVVAGDSVGGNMAIATCLLAKQRGGPKIAYQVLFYPVTDSSFDSDSYKHYADGPWLTKPAMQWFWNAYAPDQDMRGYVTASPMLASREDLVGLPPTLVITGENDVLRDEGEAFAHKLMSAGVDVTAVRFLGAIHDFVMLNPLSKTPAARNAITLACECIRSAVSSQELEPQEGRERGYM